MRRESAEDLVRVVKRVTKFTEDVEFSGLRRPLEPIFSSTWSTSSGSHPSGYATDTYLATTSTHSRAYAPQRQPRRRTYQRALPCCLVLILFNPELITIRTTDLHPSGPTPVRPLGIESERGLNRVMSSASRIHQFLQHARSS